MADGSIRVGETGRARFRASLRDRLPSVYLRVYSTRYGLPVGSYTLGTRLEGKYAGRQVLAEVGSFSLELGRLAQITGKMEYYDIVSSLFL